MFLHFQPQAQFSGLMSSKSLEEEGGKSKKPTPKPTEEEGRSEAPQPNPPQSQTPPQSPIQAPVVSASLEEQGRTLRPIVPPYKPQGE